MVGNCLKKKKKKRRSFSILFCLNFVAHRVKHFLDITKIPFVLKTSESYKVTRFKPASLQYPAIPWESGNRTFKGIDAVFFNSVRLCASGSQKFCRRQQICRKIRLSLKPKDVKILQTVF